MDNTNFMKKYLWILAAVVALVACGKNEKPGVTPVVTDAVSVAPTSLSFTRCVDQCKIGQLDYGESFLRKW